VTLELPESDTGPSEDIAFKLLRGEVLLFEVWAETADCDCDWVLTLNYLDLGTGERGSVEVRNEGEPWRSTASRNAESYTWSPDQRDWEPSP
jgi:hypothetical protein